jgi:hypothetical protein
VLRKERRHFHQLPEKLPFREFQFVAELMIIKSKREKQTRENKIQWAKINFVGPVDMREVSV